MKQSADHPRAVGKTGAVPSTAGAVPSSGVPGKTTLTQALPVLHVGRGAGVQPGPAAPKPAGGGSGDDKAGGALDWAGAGKAGEVFRNETIESFADPASADSVEIRTAWTLADFESYELSTSAVLEARREIRIRLGRGASLIATSRARAWFHADRLPNDVHAALHAPARLIQHDGSIFVTDERGMHLLRSLVHPAAKEQSVAGLLGNEPVLGFATEPGQRIREADQLAAVTVPQYDANLAQLEGILRDAPSASAGLTRYIQARLGYESPPEEPLTTGRHLLHRIDALAQTATGYEGPALQGQLAAMSAAFHKLVAAAERAHPADKGLLDHAADAARAVGKAIVGVGTAVKEVALMARDLGLWVLDEVAGALGTGIDWSASSSIGKAYQSGKSTGEIFRAMVDGIATSFHKALEHADNGDYSKLMDLGAEVALDVAIGVATAGAGAAAGSATRASRMAAGALALTEDAAAALAARARAVLARAEQTLAKAPAEARRAVRDAQAAFQGLLEGLTQAARVTDTGTGAKLAVLDPGAIPRAIQRVRGAQALESAAGAMKKLRGPAARAQGERVVGRLEQLATKAGMPDAIHALARRISDGKDKAKLVAALDDALSTWALQIEPEVLARALRRAADAVDPLKYLDDASWVMSRPGLNAPARQGLLRHSLRVKDPLDLRWLRELTDLPDDMLQFMALDPATHWKPLMKVSTRPSDHFPSSVKKLLEPKDYANAAAKLRGVAGELIFEVPGIELPGGLKIVGRQVKAGTKTIDFAVHDARGTKAKLEVKAWNQRRWQKELSRDPTNIEPGSPLGRMLEQLQAAKATGEPVYLAVPDVIGDEIGRLRRLLRNKQLDDVTVFTFAESKLKEAASKLRTGLALAGGVALVTADQIAEVDDD
jgi:hypothetical protein